MGQSTDGILAYGYDLGGDDSGWKIQQAGEYGELPTLPWFDPENEDGDDFQSAAERHLLAEIAGFTERWAKGNEGYWDREKAAKAGVGVQFDSYCSGGYPMFLLATKVITVHRGSVEDIDMAALAIEPEMNGWDDKLHAALTALGITPVQAEPRWLLASYWG